MTEVVPCKAADQGGRHRGQVVHGHTHGERRFQVCRVGDSVDVRCQRNATKEDQIVDAVEDVECRSMINQGISGKDEDEADITGTEHDTFTETIHESSEKRRRECDQHLIDED